MRYLSCGQVGTEATARYKGMSLRRGAASERLGSDRLKPAQDWNCAWLKNEASLHAYSVPALSATLIMPRWC
jgi:hypothetical protein